MSIVVTRDNQSTDLIIRISQAYAVKLDPRNVVVGLESEIRGFLVKEFIKIHGKNILNAIRANDVSFGIGERIAEEIQKLFFKETKA